MNLKPNLYVHRNPYARGFGLKIQKEGTTLLTFTLWHLSGTLYFGKYINVSEDAHRKDMAIMQDKLDKCQQEILHSRLAPRA